MAEFINIGDMVEGAKCEIYTRKEMCKGLREDPITHSSMMVYELDRNCSVEVTEKLLLQNDALEKRNEMNIHCDVGDKLKADAITLYVDTRRKLKFEVKEGQTSTHGGQLASSKRRTIGEIKYPFQNIQSVFALISDSSKSIKSISL